MWRVPTRRAVGQRAAARRESVEVCAEGKGKAQEGEKDRGKYEEDRKKENKEINRAQYGFFNSIRHRWCKSW